MAFALPRNAEPRSASAVLRSMPLRCFGVRTLAVTHVRFVHVLEQRIALCLVSLLCVSARQALVESVLDRKPHSGASKTLAPSSTACARSNFSADALPILARSTPR